MREMLLWEMEAIFGGAVGDDLSPRQMQCLKLVLEGQSSCEIARSAKLSPRTVDHYLADACERLATRNRHVAATVAQSRGLLDAENDAI
jgi:DNA-binding CsgD family transcriptional regulator